MLSSVARRRRATVCARRAAARGDARGPGAASRRRSALAGRPSLAQRLGSSRSVFDRVRSLSGVGALSEEQLDVVEEVLLRSDVGRRDDERRPRRPARRTARPTASPPRVRDDPLESLTARSTVTHDRRRAAVCRCGSSSGVNGVGKTTTIGKLAKRHHRRRRKRRCWPPATPFAPPRPTNSSSGRRARAQTSCARPRARTPARSCTTRSVAPHARGADIVLADTAGRRANSTNLLDELAKVRRVADREPGQVVETLLVLDATTGQNALSQAREFLAAADVTGIVLTKLDGTARGGIVVAIERDLGIPVKFVGVGEGVDDLIVFDPEAFVDSLLEA